jgi:hypothetical protein
MLLTKSTFRKGMAGASAGQPTFPKGEIRDFWLTEADFAICGSSY